jgi:outer membrane biosynthesis protein TonB
VRTAEFASPRLGAPATVSAFLHAGMLVAMWWTSRDAPPPVLPPIYRVNIVAAPPGPRAIGEVRPRTPQETPPAPAPRPTAEVAPRTMPSPDRSPAGRTPRQVTPAPVQEQPASSAPAPVAGGGPVGGKGADVATVQTAGIDFPFPGYLNNIVRQVALRFTPPERDARLRAEIMFLIHRNGSVTNIRFITRSGSYPFDLEAQGAVEAAGTAGSFGPLPEGFNDDVLPVSFSFDPQVLR